MEKNFSIRPATQTDIPQLVHLMNSQYMRKKDDSYFLWQYFDAYFPTVLMCALYKQRIIGMFGIQKRTLRNGDVIGQAIDMLIEASWRGKGLFIELGKRSFEYFSNLNALCVFPNLNGNQAVVKSLGFQNIARVNSVIIQSQNIKANNNTAENKDSYDDTAQNSMLQFYYDYEICNWRFQRNPVYNYFNVQLPSGEYATTKEFTDPVTKKKYGDIVDFECDLNNQTLLNELFYKASMHLKNQGAESITTWALPDTLLNKIIKGLGFKEMKQERFFCVKVLQDEYNYLYDLKKWHLVQADSEIY